MCVSNPKKCYVTFTDTTGVEHVAEVQAESVFEAAALALKKFRRSDWSRESSFETGILRIEVRESSFFNVLVSDLEQWLRKSGGSPREMSMRDNIRRKIEEQ